MARYQCNSFSVSCASGTYHPTRLFVTRFYKVVTHVVGDFLIFTLTSVG